MLSGNSLRQTVHTHRASVHQAAKLVAALLRVARVTAGLAESNGSLPPGLWLTSPAGCLPRTRISSGTVRSVIDHGLHFLHLAVRAMHLYGAHLSVCPIFYVGHIFSRKNKASVLYKPGATQGPHITLCPKECPSFYFWITLSKINRFRWVLVC